MRRARRPDGLSRQIVDADIDSAALGDDAYDTLASSRRGGGRFVDGADIADIAWAEGIRPMSEPRTSGHAWSPEECCAS